MRSAAMISCVASDEVDAGIVMLLDAGRDREDIGSKMMSSGGKPTSCVSKAIGPPADFHLAGLRIAWPFSSNAITTTAAP